MAYIVVDGSRSKRFLAVRISFGNPSSKTLSFGSRRASPRTSFIIRRTKLHGARATFARRFRATAMNNATTMTGLWVQSGCEKNFSERPSSAWWHYKVDGDLLPVSTKFGGCTTFSSSSRVHFPIRSDTSIIVPLARSIIESRRRLLV